jgi:BioD-like phosphotransacetylase family protein
VKPLYVVGTQQNVGKTTFCLGLIAVLRNRQARVGYLKPLGQRVSTVAGRAVHDDALVVSQAMHLEDPDSAAVTVALTRGRVEQEIREQHAAALAQEIAAVYARQRDASDVVIVEGMGHVATGSCIALSGADVARLVGARALLITGGGIGRTIDDIALCATFLTARGADLLGVVVNKVWPEKYDRIKEAVTLGLAHLGIRTFGTMPYEEMLAAPTVGQVAQELGGRIICGTASLSCRVGKTIVAAMEAHHMVDYLKDRALVITPGDRSDNILAILSTYTLSPKSPPPVAGIILTGGFVPIGNMMNLLVESGLPAIMCREDTYTLAARLKDTVFKIPPDDHERVDAARRLIEQHVDIESILAALRA